MKSTIEIQKETLANELAALERQITIANERAAYLEDLKAKCMKQQTELEMVSKATEIADSLPEIMDKVMAANADALNYLSGKEATKDATNP